MGVDERWRKREEEEERRREEEVRRKDFRIEGKKERVEHPNRRKAWLWRKEEDCRRVRRKTGYILSVWNSWRSSYKIC